jgi:glyoxylase-like metal-dependent hydrolase (beta-lactamase superfamily II)
MTPPETDAPLAGLEVVLADNPGPLTLDGTRTYLVGERRLAILDPGPLQPDHVDKIERAVAGRPVEAVCLTHAHADHTAAALEVSARVGAPIAAAAETLLRLDIEGRELLDGDSIEVDSGDTYLEALYTPGHSGDHLSYLWHPSMALFTGDLVLGKGSSMVAHPDGSVGAYLASLDRLISLDPPVILPGHGEPVRDAVKKLEEYRDHRLERHRQIVEAVTIGGARTVPEIRANVYGELPDDRLKEAADLSIRAHLEYVRSPGPGDSTTR